VAFVFAGCAEEKDGSEIFLDSDLLRKSINYRLMSKGLVYPTYYNGLFSELREEFTRAMKKAKYDGLGIWQHDKTTTGFSADLDTLTTDSVIMPKLFRRIVEHASAGEDAGGFRDFLAANCEPLVKIPQVHFTRLETVVEIEDGRIRLTQAPEDLIFLDKVMCKKRYQQLLHEDG
jgi:hypothetical protein